MQIAEVADGGSGKQNNLGFFDYLFHPSLNPLNQNNYMQNGPVENNKKVSLPTSISTAYPSTVSSNSFMNWIVVGGIGLLLVVLLSKN